MLQTEQYVKNELAKKLGQLQEKLGELKETVTLPPPRRAPRRALASGEGGTWARKSWVPGPGQRQNSSSLETPVIPEFLRACDCCPCPLTFRGAQPCAVGRHLQ